MNPNITHHRTVWNNDCISKKEYWEVVADGRTWNVTQDRWIDPVGLWEHGEITISCKHTGAMLPMYSELAHEIVRAVNGDVWALAEFA